MKNIWRIIISALLLSIMASFSPSHADGVKSAKEYLRNNVANSAAVRDLRKSALKKIHDGNRRNWERMNLNARYIEKPVTQPNQTPAFIGKRHNIAIEDIISTRDEIASSVRGIKRRR